MHWKEWLKIGVVAIVAVAIAVRLPILSGIVYPEMTHK